MKINVLKKYGNFSELNHGMITELIDYIEVGEKAQKNGKRIVKVHWNI